MSNQLPSSLPKAVVDRHLLSNLPAVNIRMTQISFTVEYYKKELFDVGSGCYLWNQKGVGHSKVKNYVSGQICLQVTDETSVTII
jgi:hypothetical protein